MTEGHDRSVPFPFKTALVTGASGGIGRGLATWLARRGTRVFAAARRRDQLEALARQVADGIGGGDDGGAILPVTMDVTDARAVIDAIRAIDDGCGGLDLVVANAAVSAETPGQAPRWETIDEILAVNVRGLAATLSAVADRMAARRRGQLCGLSSLSSVRGLPGYAAYSGSKAFVSTFLEGLRVDLGRHGVKVTTIEPGFVRTPGTAGYTFQMPFLVELDDAVERIGRAIVRGDAALKFPWPLALAARMMRLLPNGVWDRLARRFVPR
jgi:NADP-dependent 3-hydroxy acid dehydrogenase YdfG